MAGTLRLFTVPVALAGLALAAAGCQTTPKLLGRDVVVLAESGSLRALNPTDVAVAPVQVAEGVGRVPFKTIRWAAQRGLATRLYSPLSAEVVDEAIAGADGNLYSAETGAQEASYQPGVLGEDAVFEVTVLRWDDRNWELRKTLDVTLEARMLDPRNPLGSPLWAGRLNQVFNVSRDLNPGAGGQRALELACTKMFRELLSRMPERNPAPDYDPGLDADEGTDLEGFDVERPESEEEGLFFDDGSVEDTGEPSTL